MALLVCCPCGNPLDCDHLELVVTLTCPRCHREMTLEAEYAEDRIYRAVLTVMDGPFWVGEQFVLPVNEELKLGKAAGNWLSLESDQLSDVQCLLRFSTNGRVEIEDLDSETGTWIGESRIAKGILESQQCFSIGEYRFRLDFMDIGGEAALIPDRVSGAVAAGPLPALKKVGSGKTMGDWLVRNRYGVCRWFLIVFAWCNAVYHVCILRGQAAPNRWEWYSALGIGAFILIALLVSARRVTLSHPILKFLSLGILLGICIANVIWARPLPAIGALLLASILPLFTLRIPSRSMAYLGGIVGIVAIVEMGIVAILSLVDVTAVGG